MGEKAVPGKKKRNIESTGYFFVAPFVIAFIIFIIFGFRLSADSWKRAFQTLPISYSYVTLSLPVSSVFMTVTAILKIRETVKRLTGRGAAGMEGGNA